MCSIICYCLSNPSLPDCQFTQDIYLRKCTVWSVTAKSWRYHSITYFRTIFSMIQLPLFQAYLECICTALVCAVWRNLTLICTSAVFCFILIGILLLIFSSLFIFCHYCSDWHITWLDFFFFNLADVFVIVIQLEDSWWGCMETRHKIAWIMFEL